MFVVESYPLAVFFCVITMFCWGSWANTQKAVGKRWRFELFYWDYTLGVLLAAIGFAFTMGSTGASGRSFLTDLTQSDSVNLGWAVLGGIIFNAANLLLVAAIDIAGMAVAFPVGIGIALVLGVLVNYMAEPAGNPIVLFLGVAFIVAAVLLDTLAYRKIPDQGGKGGRKGTGPGSAVRRVDGLLLSLRCDGHGKPRPVCPNAGRQAQSLHRCGLLSPGDPVE